jgi:hypothetical protein
MVTRALRYARYGLIAGGIFASLALSVGLRPAASVNWSSVDTKDSVNWSKVETRDSVNWSSVDTRDSVNWSSVNWSRPESVNWS